MPLHSITTTIDGTDYKIGQLPWLEGLPVFRCFVERAGEVLIKTLLTLAPDKRAKLLEGDPAIVAPLVAKVFGSMDAADLQLVTRTLGRVIEVRVGDTEAYVGVLNLEDHFTGRYTHFLRVLYEAARHNFAGPT